MQFNYNLVTQLAQEHNIGIEVESMGHELHALVVSCNARDKEPTAYHMGQLMVMLTILANEQGIDLREAYHQGYKRLSNELKKTAS